MDSKKSTFFIRTGPLLALIAASILWSTGYFWLGWIPFIGVFIAFYRAVKYFKCNGCFKYPLLMRFLFSGIFSPLFIGTCDFCHAKLDPVEKQDLEILHTSHAE